MYKASSAQEALSILGRESAIELVLTDQAMPQMTGAELIVEIKLNPTRPGPGDHLMLRATWNGFLCLSLVSCPIYLQPASTPTKSIRLNQAWVPRTPRPEPHFAEMDEDDAAPPPPRCFNEDSRRQAPPRDFEEGRLRKPLDPPSGSRCNLSDAKLARASGAESESPI